MAEEELSTENEEDLWAAAAEDLSQQKEMLRKASDEQKQANAAAESAAADTPDAPSGEADATPAKTAVAVSGEIERILDIPLKITVELGRTKMLINDLLQLGQGSVIELTKLVGEPLEVLVNEKLVAKGEVVVVNEKFGVRLTEVVSPSDRIEQLG
ncbi:Flagellar motor switch protein FliN [hydrothermal vent metagenome]|uniref:Flagellar motor switch protein FliN n=1 Tax=hydrothermal vent metagenome TaxID=652676 RepID=A0A3B1C222_9ZZZZ